MRTFSLLALTLLSITGYSQSIEELDKRNGFKDIQMNSSVLDYEGLEYQKDDEHPYYKNIKIYIPKKGYYQSIGSIKIYDMQVLTYGDSIFRIVVTTEKNPDLYKALKNTFGEPEYHLRNKFHHWTGENLRLSYIPVGKDKLELTYESFLMKDKLKEDEEEEIEEIISDF